MTGDRHSRRSRWWQWWPALAIVALSTVLWNQFPAPVEPRAFKRADEPSVEYVTLAPGMSFLTMRPDEFAHRSGFGSTGDIGSLAPDFESLIPGLATPAFLPRSTNNAEAVAIDAAPRAHGAFAGFPPPPEQVWQPPPPSKSSKLWFNVSPSLAAADFIVPPPPIIFHTDAHARFFVETAEDGSVAHVLLDSKPASPDADGFIDAMLDTLSRARASTNASGFVDAGVTIPPQDKLKE